MGKDGVNVCSYRCMVPVPRVFCRVTIGNRTAGFTAGLLGLANLASCAGAL